MERYSFNSWLNIDESTKDAEVEDVKTPNDAPLVSNAKKRVITKVVTRIAIVDEEPKKPFGRIETMFKKAHSIKELEELASGVNTKALVVQPRSKTIFDHIRTLANAVKQLFVES